MTGKQRVRRHTDRLQERSGKESRLDDQLLRSKRVYRGRLLAVTLKRKGDMARASRGFHGTWNGTRRISRDGGRTRDVDERRERSSRGWKRRGEKKVARRTKQKGDRSIQKPRPGLVNTATESLVFLSTAATMGPQETKDERRAIYFGPLFRSSAESGLRGCFANREMHGEREREREEKGGEGVM